MNNNQQINYTTKPIELPLSTEKEYVLVDEKGYLEKCSTVDTTKLLKPFKLTSVDSDGDGKIWSERVIQHARRNDNQCKYFHEVIRQPQTNEFNTDSIAVTEQEKEEFNAMANNSEIPNSSEWKNGDACSYYYWEGKEWRDGVYVIQDNGFHVIRDIEDDGYAGVTKKHLRKPETQEQREDRERLEAAKDLACVYWGVKTDAEPSPELLKAMLRIVDKTNYRLTK